MATTSILTGGILSIPAGIRHSATTTTTADFHIHITILSITIITAPTITTLTTPARFITDSAACTIITTSGECSTGITDIILITAIITITATTTVLHMAGGSGPALFRQDGAAAAAAQAALPELFRAGAPILQQVRH